MSIVTGRLAEARARIEFLEAKQSELMKALELAEKLSARLDAIHADPIYMDVWFSYHNHGGNYEHGPKYDLEHLAFKEAIARAKL